MQKSNTPQAVHDCHQFLLWFIPHLQLFPKTYRFSLAQRLENHILDILEHLIVATYSHNKITVLQKANARLDVVRHLWRVAFELKVIPAKRYEHGAKLIINLGAQVGGWLKQQHTKHPRPA